MSKYPSFKPKADPEKVRREQERRNTIESFMNELWMIYTSDKTIDLRSTVPVTCDNIGIWSTSADNPGISIRISTELSDAEPIDTKEKLGQLLLKNLTASGMHRNYVNGIGQFILGAYLIRMPLFLVGITAEEVANAISLSICGKYPPIIYVASGVTDLTQVLQAINSCNENIVVVRNSSEFIDDELFQRLRDEVPDKEILFSVTLHDTVKLYPPSVFSYAGIIDCETCWAFLQKTQLKPGVYDGKKIEGYDKDSYESFLKFLIPYAKTLNLMNGYCMFRAELLAAALQNWKVITPDSTHIHPLLHEMYTISVAENREKEFCDYLKELPDKRLYKILESLHDTRLRL